MVEQPRLRRPKYFHLKNGAITVAIPNHLLVGIEQEALIRIKAERILLSVHTDLSIFTRPIPDLDKA